MMTPPVDIYAQISKYTLKHDFHVLETWVLSNECFKLKL